MVFAAPGSSRSECLMNNEKKTSNWVAVAALALIFVLGMFVQFCLDHMVVGFK